MLHQPVPDSIKDANLLRQINFAFKPLSMKEVALSVDRAVKAETVRRTSQASSFASTYRSVVLCGDCTGATWRRYVEYQAPAQFNRPTYGKCARRYA
jgi:hypothetical protein